MKNGMNAWMNCQISQIQIHIQIQKQVCVCITNWHILYGLDVTVYCNGWRLILFDLPY